MENLKKLVEGNIIFNTGRDSLLQIIDALNEFGIKKNSKIFLYTLREKREYFVIKLLNLITGINTNVINNYVNVCDTFQVYKKLVLNKEDHDKFIDAYNKIINSNIYITEHKKDILNDTIWNDYIDYILLDFDNVDDASEFIIIYNFNDLVEESNYTKEEILTKFKDYNQKYNTKFLLF